MDTTTLITIVAVAEAVLLGVIGVLKVVAPKTKTTIDDAWLTRLEAVEAVVEKILPGSTDPAK